LEWPAKLVSKKRLQTRSGLEALFHFRFKEFSELCPLRLKLQLTAQMG
jgi:hypothetical protein